MNRNHCRIGEPFSSDVRLFCVTSYRRHLRDDSGVSRKWGMTVPALISSIKVAPVPLVLVAGCPPVRAVASFRPEQLAHL
jgi:hypothetical protein